MKLTTFCFSFLMFAIQAFGLGDEMHFRHYDNRDGLSHNTVFCAIQDRSGFMWFGTNEGLNRFDGYTFKVYEYDSRDSLSLIQNRVNSMCEASDGTIWICTEDGVCTYHPETDSFHPFRLTPEYMKPSYFLHIVEDEEHDLWMIQNNCFVRYTPSDKSFKIYDSKSYFSPSAIEISSSGSPIFADSLSLWRYSRHNDSFTKTPVLKEDEIKKGNHIYTLKQLPNKKLLIGTLRGLLMLDESSQSLSVLIPDVTINAIEMQDNSKCWIGTEDGLYVYDIYTKEMRHSRYTSKNTLSIKDNSIYDICRDSEGGMWLVGYFDGISYLPNRQTAFNFLIDDNGEKIIDANAIRQIVVDNYDNIWIGSEDNGLFCYNPLTKKVTNYSPNTVQAIPDFNIQGLLVDGNTLWAGTARNGVVLIDIPSGKIIRRFYPENTGYTLSRRHIQALFRTKEGHILAGTDVGMFEYDPVSGEWSRWKNLDHYIRQIYEDSDSDLWIVTGIGLFRKFASDGHIERIDVPAEYPLYVESYNLTSIFEDSRHRIWITSGNGFVRFNKYDNSMVRISRKDGLPSYFTFRMEEANDGHLWISTAAGLVRYNPETGEMNSYNYDDDLLEVQFNYNSSCRLPDGTLFFGTLNNGLVYFKPEEFEERDINPNLFITNATTFVSNSEQKEIQLEKQPEVSYRSTLTIYYVALNFSSPKGLDYEYRLLPLNEEWIPVKKKRDITFANLSPGKYTFCVRSRDEYSIHDNERKLEFSVKPPLLLSKFAYATYFLIVFIAGALIIRYKQRQQRKDFALKQMMYETQKEKELYNEKMNFFSVIVHEIRTPLTLIKAPLDKILNNHKEPKEFSKELDIIERNTNRLLTLSNQMLDFKRVECENFTLEFRQMDINLLLSDILKGFQPLVEQEGLTFTFQSPEEPIYADVSPEDFGKIISNLMSNAIKYSAHTISVNLMKNPENQEEMTIEVINDGETVPKDERNDIFKPFFRSKKDEFKTGSGIGLSIVQSFVSMHMGTIAYSVDDGGNNVFRLTFPLHQKNIADTAKFNEPDSSALTDEKLNEESSGYTLLIVEDNDEMRRFLRDELSEDFRIIEAKDGIDALEKLSNNFVNLIICDLMMPRMDGFELCRRLKKDINFSQIPLIILTALNSLQARIKTLDSGADAYIEKPFSLDLLRIQINNLLHTREKLYEALRQNPSVKLSSLVTSSVDNDFIRKLNAYISDNISIEHLNMNQVAAAMNMSYISMYRKIKLLTGMVPLDYVKIFRLKRAAELLKQNKLQIQEISYQVGFSSPAYFSSCFSKYYKMSPSDYVKDGKLENQT